MEIFAWNKYGGFGKATRMIGRELVKKGIEVFAVVPRRKNQKEFEILDGIKVFSFPKYNPFLAVKMFSRINADIYHSEEPSFGTYLAMKEMPRKIHIVTSRDPRFWNDWVREFIHPSYNKFQVIANYLYEDNFLVKKSVQKANRVFSAAIFLSKKVSQKYSLKNEAAFLPTPIEVPVTKIEKSEEPTICYLARWDKRKKPELFLQLAKSFPEIKFIAIGMGRNRSYDSYLRKRYSNLKNLTMTGFINQFENNEIDKILDASWILVNTATREGLPNSFLEALAHKCAILSSLNPENVTERFGYCVKNDDFKEGLIKLLENDNWRIKGEQGQDYVIENYELKRSIDQHIKIYKNLLNNFNN
jgi:glycosyltransferase involved in cell wall biosynthesis